MTAHDPPRVHAFAAVAVGGALGALARWGVDVAFAVADLSFAYATLCVNVVGCFLMGLLASYVLDHVGERSLWRPFLAVGVLGGFTTFSAFALDVVLVTIEGSVLLGVAYLVASLGGSLVALWAGFEAGRALRGRRAEP